MRQCSIGFQPVFASHRSDDFETIRSRYPPFVVAATPRYVPGGESFRLPPYPPIADRKNPSSGIQCCAVAHLLKKRGSIASFFLFMSFSAPRTNLQGIS